MRRFRRVPPLMCLLGVLFAPNFVGVLHAGNDILGEIQLLGATKVERTSGVWVDGQYLGYLQELKGSKKILLLPGEHEIVVRQGGYLDFAQKIGILPGEKKIISVTMERDSRVQMPQVTAEIKLDVNPNRAAVFVDDAFVGNVSEFSGIGHGMLVSAGKHRVKIALPGYQAFETEVSLLARQKITIKTDLQPVSVSQAATPSKPE